MNKSYQIGVGLAVLTLVSACSSTNQSGQSLAKIHKQNQVEFNQCQTHVLDMDTSAKKNQSLAQYLTAATAGTSCLQAVIPGNPLVSTEQKMQLHAMTVLDFVKGGDIGKARSGLGRFEVAYSGKDLFFTDNTSFIDTFSLLLHEKDIKHNGVHLNVNKHLVNELKRKQTWLNR
jgi:hypothetical protein